MMNRKDLLKFIFESEKRDSLNQYFGYWLNEISVRGLNNISDLPFINVITYHSFESPIANYNPFKMGKIKTGFRIVYNISSSDIITAQPSLNNEDEAGYKKYLDKIQFETYGKDLKELIYTNLDRTKDRRFGYNKEECKQNSERLMQEYASGLKSKITYDFYEYEYFDWAIVISNHIARFTTTSSPNGSSSSTKVEVLTTNESEKESFYRIMKEKERVKGVFYIKKNIEELIDLIKKVEVIGTDEEPYDPKYDHQLNLDFKGRLK